MEKSRTRIAVLIVLMVASLASYIFLNHAGKSQITEEPIEQLDEGNNFEAKDPTMNLPEIKLIKKVLEAGIRLLPAS